MEKKYLVLVYCKCAAHNFFFERKDLEEAKSLAKAASTDIDRTFAPLTTTKVKLIDISNNEEIEY